MRGTSPTYSSSTPPQSQWGALNITESTPMSQNLWFLQDIHFLVCSLLASLCRTRFVTLWFSQTHSSSRERSPRAGGSCCCFLKTDQLLKPLWGALVGPGAPLSPCLGSGSRIKGSEGLAGVGGTFPPWPRSRSGPASYSYKAGGLRTYHAPFPDPFPMMAALNPHCSPMPAGFEG